MEVMANIGRFIRVLLGGRWGLINLTPVNSGGYIGLYVRTPDTPTPTVLALCNTNTHFAKLRLKF